jgi:hypothetical protein
MGSVRETSSFLGLPGLHAAAATAVGQLTRAQAGAPPPGLSAVELVRRSISDIRASIEELQQSVAGADPIYEAHRQSDAPAAVVPAQDSPAPAKRVVKKKQTLTERFASEDAKAGSAPPGPEVEPARSMGPSAPVIAKASPESLSVSESVTSEAVAPTRPLRSPTAVSSLSSIGEPAADGTVRVSAETIQDLLNTVHQLMASQAEMMQLIKQRGDVAAAPVAAPSAEQSPKQSGSNPLPTPAGATSAPTDGQKVVALPARRTMPTEAGDSGVRSAPSPSPQRVQLFVFQSPAGLVKAVPADIVAEVRDVDLKTLDGARGLWVLRAEDRLIPLVPCDHGGRQLTEGLATAILCRINGAWMGLLVRKAIGAVDADLCADKPGSRKGRYATLVGDGATIEVIDAGRCLGEAIDGSPRKPRASDLAQTPPQPRSSTVVQATDLFERKPTR